MVIQRFFAVLALLGLAACGEQVSRNMNQPVSVGVGVSTLGLMIEPTTQVNDKTSIRAPIAFGNASFSETIDGITYDVDGTLGGVGLMADYYPSGGSLRVSGGVFRSNLKVEGRATGTVDVGANTYLGVDLRTKVKPSVSFSPAVSVGFDRQIGSGWGISSDVGAIYTGGFDVSATDQTGIVAQSDLDAEVASINDELSGAAVLPFVKLGVTYRW